MNNQEFVCLLEQLEDAAWQSVMDGQALVMVDDMALTVGDVTHPCVLVKGGKSAMGDALQLRQETIRQAAAILDKYYFIRPLSRKGFEHQAEQHIRAKGAQAFAAIAGQWPAFTLFVEGGELLAESAGSARHRYGAFCELDKPMAGVALTARVDQWLHSGEAYQLYLNMNVCRYNC